MRRPALGRVVLVGLLVLCSGCGSPGTDRVSYPVPGLGARKQAVLAAGGTSADAYDRGAVLNTDLNQDLHVSQRHWSMDVWFAGQRGGATGLGNPAAAIADITDRSAVYWIRGRLDAAPDNLTNDIRFFVHVPAI